MREIPEKPRVVFALSLILLVSAVTFSPVLDNGFTNWDDPVYILNNPLLRDLSGEGFRKIFSSYVSGNYHPLTIISLAVDRHLFGFNAAGYHLHSLLLHLVNTLLVFYLIRLLTGKYLAALVTALIFGIHPLQAEAVAWASSRKDLLFAFFYLCSLISYVRGVYRREEWQGFYYLSFVFFVFSLLAKPQAASLPIVLLGIDSYCRRPLNKTAWLEKIPFIFWSLVAGAASFLGQRAMGSIFPSGFSLAERIFLLCDSFLSYLARFVFPVGLSNCYPYPVAASGHLPLPYVLAPLAVAGGIFLLKRLRPSLEARLGIVLFAAPIVFVLKFVPVGDFITADRYMYVPIIGLGLLTGLLVDFLWDKAKTGGARAGLAVVCALVILTLCRASFERSLVWRNSVTLWSDVLRKEPTAYGALINRAGGYVQRGEYAKALHDLDQAVKLVPDSLQAVTNRAAVHSLLGNIQPALNDFDRALGLDPGNAVIFNNRGDLFLKIKNYDKALRDLSRAVRLDPGYELARFNRARAFWALKDYPRALADLDRLIAMDPEDPRAFAGRGEVYLAMGKYDAAMKDFAQSLKLNPRSLDARLGYARAYEAKLRVAAQLREAIRSGPEAANRK